MKDKPEQSAVESDSIANELRLAKSYWLKTIQPDIAGRPLQGTELFVARDALSRLGEVEGRAKIWNFTKQGKLSPIPTEALAELQKEEFRQPEESYRDETLKPETLAAIAAPLMPQSAGQIEAIRVAHELLISAKRYINTLPDMAGMKETLVQAHSMVTFEEIEDSNRKGSGRLRLLPPVGGKRKGRNEEELSERPLSRDAIKEAVKRFLEDHVRRVTRKGYDLGQAVNERLAKQLNIFRLEGTCQPRTYEQWQDDTRRAIKDSLENNWISVGNLCVMRWERFFRQSRSRADAANTRNDKREQKQRDGDQ